MKIPIKLLFHIILISCCFKVYFNFKKESSKDQILLKNNGYNSKQKDLNNTINTIEQEIEKTTKMIDDLKYNLFHDIKYDIGYFVKNKNIFSKENLQKVKNFIRLIEYEEQLSYVENNNKLN